MKANNISFIYGPKQKDPFTGEWNNKYLVPAVRDQQGDKNYIVVTCTPSMNGIYMWKGENRSKYRMWMNGKKPCYYIPVDDCVFRPFEDLDMTRDCNKALIAEVKKQQAKWYKGEVKGRDAYKKKKPDWML